MKISSRLETETETFVSNKNTVGKKDDEKLLKTGNAEVSLFISDYFTITNFASLKL